MLRFPLIIAYGVILAKSMPFELKKPMTVVMGFFFEENVRSKKEEKKEGYQTNCGGFV